MNKQAFNCYYLITFLVYLNYTEYINEEWIMKHVWNNEQLMNNKNEIQKSLIHHIVDDKLQEGTLVTDLIDSIKSPFTTPQQLVSKSLINIVLINYYVTCSGDTENTGKEDIGEGIRIIKTIC